MKIIMFICVSLLLISCEAEPEYNSCSIKTSDASSSVDKARDESQCWNMSGYEKDKALTWCKSQVQSYISSQYTFFPPNVTTSVSESNCP